jgi:phthiodiolone/phenolphthiodiolone dimycocerosates ketoreductase
MPGFGVGIMNNTINSRYGPKPPIQADYLTAVACKVIPKMDAHLEPWTMLGYLAAKNNLRRMRLGVAGAIQPSLSKSAATTAPYVKIVRALRRL